MKTGLFSQNLKFKIMKETKYFEKKKINRQNRLKKEVKLVLIRS